MEKHGKHKAFYTGGNYTARGGIIITNCKQYSGKCNDGRG